MKRNSPARHARACLIILAVCCIVVETGPACFAANPKPAPTFADVAYGPSPNQLLDVYIPPQGAGPFAALVWYGGIWKPAKSAPDPNRFLPKGVAVIAVETRTMSEPRPVANGDPPIAVVMNDACRVVQFVRLNAAKWNLDPRRIAVGGGSQGSLPALYVGCAGEGADPKSNDPVERESTRVACVAAYRSQPSIDPRRMQEWVPGVKWGAPALGCSFEESLKRRDALQPLISRWSPDALLNKDAAPIYFEYNWGLTRPPTVKEVDYLVHSPGWAIGFQKLAEQQGATCYVKYPDHPTEKYKDIWDFILQTLTSPSELPAGVPR